MGWTGWKKAARTGAAALLAALCLSGCSGPAAATPAPAATPAATASADASTEYFLELAFSAEYGGDGILCRWEAPISIEVHGNPTREDLATLQALLDDFPQVPGLPPVRRVAGGGNVQLFFVPLEGLGNVVPGYVPGNWGFFYTLYDKGVIHSAWVGIATDVTDQAQRNHLILEEMTQMLGLFSDSNRYEDSIFYGPWTQTQQLSSLDWEVLRLLYSARLKPGMTRSEARAALS